MALVTSTAITIPSFTALKAKTAPKAVISTSKVSSSSRLFSVKASLKDFGVAVVATAATAILASNALAVEILLGSEDGGLVFVPNVFSVNSGDKIVFKNNAGYPHNVVFDEDEIPSGVDASSISMPEEELLNGPGETYSVVLSEKGSYGFYCAPHQGAGMTGKLTVN